MSCDLVYRYNDGVSQPTDYKLFLSSDPLDETRCRSRDTKATFLELTEKTNRRRKVVSIVENVAVSFFVIIIIIVIVNDHIITKDNSRLLW